MRRRRSHVFLDTGILLAFVLPNDPDHELAVRCFERLADGEWEGAHTSDYVLAEALNFIRQKVKRPAPADSLLDLLFGSDDALPSVGPLLRIHSTRLARAIDAYRSQFARGLSLTDWTSVVAMQDAHVTQLATFDAGFRGVVDIVAL